MLCTFCPATIPGHFYRIPQKLPKSSVDKVHRPWEQKDLTLKKIGTLHFPDLGLSEGIENNSDHPHPPYQRKKYDPKIRHKMRGRMA